jgi:inositol-phosphate transport system ATP-binding protein
MSEYQNAATGGVAIELTDLSKQFGDVWAVRPLSMAVNNGEMVALLGPSGCGKTTTLLMVAGLLKPSGGHITFDGVPVEHLHPGDRDVGMVFQSYALYPHMTLYKNIAFPLETKGMNRGEIRERVTGAAEILGIVDQLQRLPGQVSGGQQQRAAIARAIVKRPSLLLLDEPLSNLDAQVRLQARAELRRLQRELGVTSLLVTHDQSEALAMADRVAVFHEGTITQFATPDTLYHAPQSLFVAGFVGHPPMNLIPGRFERGTFTFAGGGQVACPDIPDATGHLGLRPEEIVPAADDANGPDRLQGRVDVVEVQGRERLVTVTIGDGITIKVLVLRDIPVPESGPITLSIAKCRFHPFGDDGRRLN